MMQGLFQQGRVGLEHRDHPQGLTLVGDKSGVLQQQSGNAQPILPAGLQMQLNCSFVHIFVPLVLTLLPLTYRGIQIDNPDTLDDVYKDSDGNTIQAADGHDMKNSEVLKMWAEDDHHYVDIGLGFELDENGNVIDSTAFDAAISGIDIMGYGLDEDGDPKNMASLMLRLADVFEGYDPDKQTWNNGSSDDANRLVNKFLDSKEAVIDKHSELASEAEFLDTNSTQLESNFDALNTELNSIEQADPVDAITELVWAQTCYSAALQVGVNVIPQSLMDYLK